MPRTRLIGWTAFGFCLLGYGGFAAIMIAYKLGHLELREALIYGGPVAVVGEIGLWVAAEHAVKQGLAPLEQGPAEAAGGDPQADLADHRRRSPIDKQFACIEMTHAIEDEDRREGAVAEQAEAEGGPADQSGARHHSSPSRTLFTMTRTLDIPLGNVKGR